jgi:hypothetical protein
VIWVHAFEAPVGHPAPVQFDILLNDCHHVMGGQLSALRGRTSIIRVRGFWYNSSVMGSAPLSQSTIRSFPAASGSLEDIQQAHMYPSSASSLSSSSSSRPLRT